MNESTERYAVVSMKKIQWTGEDLKKVKTDPVVAEIQESIRTTGLIEPIVLTPEYKHIEGRRRTMACQNLGMKKIPAIIRAFVRHADIFGALQTEAANSHREHMSPADKKEAIKREVVLQEKLLNAQADEKPDEKATVRRTKKRATGAKTKAIAKTAKTWGVSERTVSRAVAEDGPTTLPRGFDDFDLECEPKEVDKIYRVCNAFAMAVSGLHAAKSAAARIADHGGDPTLVQRLVVQLDGQIKELKAHAPKSLCPYCKMNGEKCSHCGASGMVGEVKLSAIPAEYKKRGEDAMVKAANGKPVSLAAKAG